MSLVQTKQKEFSGAVKDLKHDITYTPLHTDLPQTNVERVLNMMFLEDDPATKERFKRHWDKFVVWLGTSSPEEQDRVLEKVRVLVRNKKGRYGANIDYYFDPTKFVRSFQSHSFFPTKVQKQRFRNQLTNYITTIDPKLVQQVKSQQQAQPKSQQQKLLSPLKKLLAELKEAYLESNGAMKEQIGKVLDYLLSIQETELSQKARDLWYKTLHQILTYPQSKERRLQFLGLVLDQVRRRYQTLQTFRLRRLYSIFPTQQYKTSFQTRPSKQAFARELVGYFNNHYTQQKLSLDNILDTTIYTVKNGQNVWDVPYVPIGKAIRQQKKKAAAAPAPAAAAAAATRGSNTWFYEDLAKMVL